MKHDLCENITRAETNIVNLQKADTELQVWRDDVNRSIGKIESSTDALAKHQLKHKHWPEHLKNGNKELKQLDIKNSKLKIYGGFITITILVIGLISQIV